MKISDAVPLLGFEVLTMPSPDEEVTGGYTGDLLSWVMGRARAGQIWITIMTNINIIAVASLSGVSAVVVAEENTVPADVIEKASEQGINLLLSRCPAFDTALAVGRILGM